MEAITIAGVAVVVVGGWYSALDLLADMGIKVRRRSEIGVKRSNFSGSCRFPEERSVKQMAGMNI